MNPPLLVEGLDVLFVTCRALAYWIAAASFVAAVVLVASLGTGAWAVRGLWRAATRPQDAAHVPEAAEPAPEPHTPAWAHREKEAA